MKKNLFLVACVWVLLIFSQSSSAQQIFQKSTTFTDVIIGGYGNYPPFGYLSNKNLHTTFRPLVNALAKEKDVFINNEFAHPNLEVTIDALKRGDIDIFLGVYHETKQFESIEIVYPALITNPITIFMLPNRINEVKSVTDIQKLKGIRHRNEIFSDFVEERLQQFNVETAKDSYELFEKLFTKQVDYIIASQYFGLIEASKLGLRNQISVAKQALWQIPMFLGISQLSRNRESLRKIITKHLKNPKNIEIIKQNMINMVNQAEKDAIGIVPPTFE